MFGGHFGYYVSSENKNDFGKQLHLYRLPSPVYMQLEIRYQSLKAVEITNTVI